MRVDLKSIKHYDNLVENTLIAIVVVFFSKAFIVYIGDFLGTSALSLLWVLLHLIIFLLFLTKVQWVRLRFFTNHAWLILVLCFLSTAWSEDQMLTLRRSFLLLSSSLLALYLVIRYDPLKFLHFMMVMIFLLSFIGIIVYFVIPQYAVMPSGEYAGIFRGVFNHKNFMGRINILGIICALALYEAKRVQLFNTLIFIGFFTVIIILSQSAGALVVLIATLFSYVLLSKMSLRAIDRAIIQFLLIILSVFIVYFFFDILSILGKSPTLTGRTALWALVLLEIAKKPFYGHGYGAFWGDESRFTSQMSWDAPSAHNGYLDIMLDLGAIGFAIFVVGMFLAIRSAWLIYIQRKSAIILFTLLFLLSNVIINTVESQVFKENVIMWVFYVFSVAIISNEKTNVPKHDLSL